MVDEEQQKRINAHVNLVIETVDRLPSAERWAVMYRTMYTLFSGGPDDGRLEFYTKFFSQLTSDLCKHGYIDADQLSNYTIGGPVQ